MEAAAFDQRLDAAAQFAILERREAIEEGRDPAREGHHQRHREGDPSEPRVEPPIGAGRVDQPEHREQQRRADRDREERAFRDVEREKLRRGAIEPVARLDSEGAPGVEGEREEGARDQHAEDRAELARVTRAEGAPGKRVDRRDSAAQREREKEEAVDDERLGEAHALPVARVGGGLAMRLQGDERGEIVGHAVLVARDVAHLAHAEEDAPRERREHEDCEDEREGSGAQGVTIVTRFSRKRRLKWRSTRPRWFG